MQRFDRLATILTGFGAVVALCAGVALIYPPAALIVLGLLLLAAFVWGVRS